MHPHAPELLQHGNPSGKQKFLQDVRSHDPRFKFGGIGMLGPEGVELPPLDPVLGSVVMVLATQFPKLQRAFVAVQSVQGLPPCPHALSSIPFLQAPLSQQPAGQVVVLQGKVTLPGPGAAEPPLLPVVPPLELLPVAPVSGLPPLLPLPELLASTAGARRPPSSPSSRRLSGSPPAPPPVAHATTMNPPPSKSAPSAAQRLPIILRLLPTLDGATRVPSPSKRRSLMKIAWTRQNAIRANCK